MKKKIIHFVIAIVLTTLILQGIRLLDEPAAWVTGILRPVLILMNHLFFILVFWFWYSLRKEKRMNDPCPKVGLAASALDIFVILNLVGAVGSAICYVLQYVMLFVDSVR